MEKVPAMLERFVAPRLLLALLIFSPLASAQSAPPQSGTPARSGTPKDQKTAPAAPAPVDFDGWGRPITAPVKSEKSAPAPRHDISGTWDPANGPDDGGQFLGAKTLPVDGKPGHEPPYTPLGLDAYSRTKPSNGFRMVPPTETNDPEIICDPQGFPREDLFQLRTTQILQTPVSVVILYEFDRVWRVIWTDGRELPKDAEPRWYGYSVGKWVDDYTLVVQTSGTDERTWVDHAGRPHTGDLHVEERFHRLDHDHLEWTVMIDDPKMYTKPWAAMDKFPMKLQPPDFDVREMICSPSDYAEYNKLVGSPASDPASNPASNKDRR
jgi:hypothetical protein